MYDSIDCFGLYPYLLVSFISANVMRASPGLVGIYIVSVLNSDAISLTEKLVPVPKLNILPMNS